MWDFCPVAEIKALSNPHIVASAAAEGELPTLRVTGEVGVHFTGSDLAAAVEYYGESRIIIDSPGGSVSDAFHFYDYIRANGLKVHVDGYGTVASATSVIMAAAGRKRSRLSPNTMYLIHNVSGNAPKDVLEAENEKLRAIYVELTGLSRKRIKEIMDSDTPMTASQAAEMGFVGSVMELQKLAAKANNIEDMEVNETVEAVEVETPEVPETPAAEAVEVDATPEETTVEVEVDITATDLVNSLRGKRKVVTFNVSKFYGETVENLTAELKERITALDEVKAELEAKTTEVDTLKAKADMVPGLEGQVAKLTETLEAMRKTPLANSTESDAAPEVVEPAAPPVAPKPARLTFEERRQNTQKQLDRIVEERYGKKPN